MKKLFLTLLRGAAISVSAIFAADAIYCKWCGSSNIGSVQQMITSACSRSPTKKHELYEGAARRFYSCKFCAFESANFTQLVTSGCSKSPSNYHQAYEGAEKASYTCRYCAFESRSFKQLVLSPCNKSPRRYHDPL